MHEYAFSAPLAPLERFCQKEGTAAPRQAMAKYAADNGSTPAHTTEN